MTVANSAAPLRLRSSTRMAGSAPPWKLLVVDDEPEVHSVTRLALHDFTFDDRKLQFISAHSGQEACEILAQESNIALMLLDVVMETDDAGLKVVEYLRHQLGNTFMRVVLRTGHPGLAPERHVIRAYDINDYRAKTELTQDRMYSLVYTALSSYKRLNSLASSQRYLRNLADEYHGLLNGLQLRMHAPFADLKDVQSQLLGRDSDADQGLGQSLEHSLRQLADIHRGVSTLNGLSTLSPSEEKVHLDATALLDAAVNRLDASLQRRIAVLDVAELPVLLGHEKWLVELLERLLDNAVRHHPGEARIQVTARPKGQLWEFEISDDGPGIAIDQWEQVFSAFSGSGTGLGLTVCKHIVAAHGGKIWLAHANPVGTCIHLTLPAGAAQGVE